MAAANERERAQLERSLPAVEPGVPILLVAEQVGPVTTCLQLRNVRLAREAALTISAAANILEGEGYIETAAALRRIPGVPGPEPAS